MWFEWLRLENIGCFRSLELSFESRFTIICGGNGVGKTTILEAIGGIFAGGNQDSLFKSIGSENDGRVSYRFRGNVDPLAEIHDLNEGSINVVKPSPNRPGKTNGVFQQNFAGQVLHIKSSRELPYQKLNQISADPQKHNGNHQEEASRGLKNDDLKNWLANRWLFGAHEGSLSEIQLKNIAFAIEAFSLLDDSVSLATVEADTFDVMLNTNDGLLPFELMSSGYRSIYFLVLGIIKELEFRKVEWPARDFDGLVLIDEIDLHLHPSWQREILDRLRGLFPRAQFIVTTHSPHVVQDADANSVLSIIRGPHGLPELRATSSSKYGFAGWSVEEILEDVMDIQTTRSNEYLAAMSSFESAMSKEDTEQIKTALNELFSMLHPNSVTRKILTLQAGPYLETEVDIP